MMLYFVHGLNGSPVEWNVFVDFFSEKGFECEAIDLKKGMNLRKTHVNNYVEKVSSIVSADDIIVGHSMGGLIMQKVVEQCDISAGVGICPAPPKGITMKTVPWWRQVRYYPYILSGTPFKPSFGLVKNVFLSGWNEGKQREIYDLLQKQSAHVSVEVMKQKISVNEQMVHTPLYFIGRKQDVTIPVDVVKKVAKKYDAKCSVVSGNHYIFLDWQEIAKKVLSFIQLF